MKLHRHILLLIGSLVLPLGCAKMGRPSGGTIDREAPLVVRTEPRADAIEVGLDRSIGIEFNEGMDGRRTGAAVFVSPRTDFRLKWRGGRRLELRPNAGLRAGQTYVVTIGTDARDLRGNRLNQSFTFAFATGAQLNRGSIAGRVVAGGKAAVAANIWAYDMSREMEGRPGVVPPAYETQSGRDGSYEFLRLGPGTYRILAFDDDDGDGTHDEDELLGLPAGDVDLAEGDEIQVGDLNLVEHGPGRAPRLKRVQALHNRVIMLSFAEPVEEGALTVAIDGLPLEGTHRSATDLKRWYLLTPAQAPGKTYKLSTVEVGGVAVPWDEPVRGSGRADRKAPSVEESQPAGELAASVESVRLSFSEAMDPAYPRSGDDLWVRSDSTQSPAGAWSWDGPASLVFATSVPLSPGAYRLQAKLDGLRDRAGLAPADSSATIAFEVLTAADLGSISGNVIDAVDSSAVKARVEAQRVGYPHEAHAVDSDVSGRYSIDGLAPGTYDVHCIDDVDGDGSADRGRLEPFEAAERNELYERPVTLARGERIDGINFELK